jgi:hypothetical protein
MPAMIARSLEIRTRRCGAANRRARRPLCYCVTVFRPHWLALALAVSSTAVATTATNPAVPVYDGLVAMRLPEGWHEIPPAVLEYFTLSTAEATGGRTAETYQHGFRPGDPDAEFALPQLLIQIREDGRLPSGHFRRLPSPDEVAAQPGSPLADHRGSLVRDLQLTGVTYDSQRHCLRIDSVMELSIEGRVAVRSASFLTERGLFTLHFYELEDRIAATAPVFEGILDSVRFDDRIGYRPRFADQWSSRHTAVVLFVLAAAFAAAAIVARRRRR